jgi:hypothetical protein
MNTPKQDTRACDAFLAAATSDEAMAKFRAQQSETRRRQRATREPAATV